MKIFLSFFLLLASSLHAQTVLFSESFDNGTVPNGWSRRFGRVEAVNGNFVWDFANRASGNDSFSAPIDLSGVTGPVILSFDFCSSATTSHSLLIGLSPDLNSSHYFIGSQSAMAPVGLMGSFDGNGGWCRVEVDVTSWLTTFTPLQLSGIRIAAESWNSGQVSSAPVMLDNIVITQIPEPASVSCWAAAVALVAVLARRKAVI